MIGAWQCDLKCSLCLDMHRVQSSSIVLRCLSFNVKGQVRWLHRGSQMAELVVNITHVELYV